MLRLTNQKRKTGRGGGMGLGMRGVRGVGNTAWMGGGVISRGG